MKKGQKRLADFTVVLRSPPVHPSVVLHLAGDLHLDLFSSLLNGSFVPTHCYKSDLFVTASKLRPYDKTIQGCRTAVKFLHALQPNFIGQQLLQM